MAIDRSATAISRANQRNAEQIAAGKAVLLTMALEDLQPAELLGGAERFDKVFAINVNLFWVRSPAKEFGLLKRLLGPDGALSLFYGYVLRLRRTALTGQGRRERHQSSRTAHPAPDRVRLRGRGPAGARRGVRHGHPPIGCLRQRLAPRHRRPCC